MKKKILDACCGGRMMWFDRKNPLALYIDNRKVKPVVLGRGDSARTFSIKPDRIMDFRKMRLKSNTFSLVVFDPPHLVSPGKKSYMRVKYGALDAKTWREDIRAGFRECFRVLKKDGVLIFKWNETDIKVREVLALAPQAPLFGHLTGKAQRTHWLTFMKI